MADVELNMLDATAQWNSVIPIVFRKLVDGRIHASLRPDWVLAKATPGAKVLTVVEVISYEGDFALASLLRKYADILDPMGKVAF